MASSAPPKKGVAYNVRIQLPDMATPGSFKANPTLAAGDVKVDKDGAGLNNIDAGGTNIPSVSPAGSTWVNLALTATEMNADVVTVQFIDQTNPKEWCDWGISIPTHATIPSDLPSAAAIATEILATDVETGYSVDELLGLMAAALLGKLSGAASTTVTIRDVNDTANRVVATVDADGNRSAVTLTP